MAGYTQPVALDHKRHRIDAFVSTSETQTRWLRHHGVSAHRGDFAKVIVTTPVGSDDVVGYYTLHGGALSVSVAPTKLGQGNGNHDIPIALIGRLAVHVDHTGQRLGRHLLLDALRRSVAIATSDLGLRGVLVNCEDAKAREFYLHVIPAFEPLPSDDLTLVVSMKSLRASLTGPAN